MNDHESLRSRPLSVAVIGAGAGGLCVAVRLKRADTPFTVIEKADGVGGTRRDSDYPGSGCGMVSRRTAWATGCPRWHKDAFGRILDNWSDGTVGPRRETLRARSDEYGFARPSLQAA